MWDGLEFHHPLPPWLAMMRKVVIGVMLLGAVLDQYQRSLAVTSWMSKVIDQQDEASSAPPPSFYFHLFDQNVAKETTTTKTNTNAQLKDGNQEHSQGNNNDDDGNKWTLPFHGRIDIPIYTAAMARDAVQPQWGFCHVRQRTPSSSIRLLDDDSDPSGKKNSSSTTDKHNNNSVKFAFVHIFKTAGSTLREFFFLYSHHCALGWMVLISCTNSQASSSSSRRMLPNTTTATTYESSSSNIITDRNSQSNIYWEPCILKKLLQRDGTFSNLTELLLTQQQLDEEHDRHQQQQQLLNHSNYSSSSSYYKTKKKKSTKKLNKKRVYPALVAESVDLLGGHFKIGMADDFVQPSSYSPPHSTHSNNKIRHITFVRQPLPKYVSGKVFHHKEIQSQEEIIALIKHEVTQARRAGEYWMRVSNYLLTPLQQQQAATTTTTNRRSNSSSSSMSSDEYKTQLILNNLVHYNVIVGIVEDMSQSMTLLQHILDPDQKMTLLFTHYGGGGGDSSTTMTTTVHPDGRKTTTLLLQPNNAPTMDKKDSSTIVMDPSSSSSRQQQQQQQQHVVNKSRFSTSSILKELETTDPEFFQEFIDYVKYEQLVYDFAWNMHQQQFQAAILPP
jgi:hypothetical protein